MMMFFRLSLRLSVCFFVCRLFFFIMQFGIRRAGASRIVSDTLVVGNTAMLATEIVQHIVTE